MCNSSLKLTLPLSGYNPPAFVLNAAKQALDRVECNQYSPTQGRLRLRQALADSYSPYFNRKLDPVTEIVITSGANEGMLSAFMGFVEPGDEVIVMEPFFDQYISNIEMAGGTVKYVALHPPEKGDSEVCPASDWRLDLKELEATITSKTRMIVINTPHNPIGKIFSKEELTGIGELCVKNNIIILSDEVSTLVGICFYLLHLLPVSFPILNHIASSLNYSVWPGCWANRN